MVRYLRQGFKDIHVEDLIAIGAIKPFDVGIPRRLARLDKFQIDGMLLRPVGQGGGDKFRTTVHAEFARIPAPGYDPIQDTLDPFGRQAHIDFYG